MGNKDNWYLLYSIQIPSIFAFNINGVQVFDVFNVFNVFNNVFNVFKTYSKHI